ncbi:MAG: hypothetical protein K2X93_25430 [Candidatus Obscuribacterales bacterium]|nr:hypothetical protein [Candidatus Obscuribacterales bacterium]
MVSRFGKEKTGITEIVEAPDGRALTYWCKIWVMAMGTTDTVNGDSQ